MQYSINKKIIAAAAVALVCNIAVAQKTTTKQETSNTVANNNVLTEQQAYAVIKYSNAVIDLHNSYIQALQSHQSTLKNTADENVVKLKRNIKTQPFFVQCDRNELSPESDKANRVTLKNIPAIPEKQNLQQLSAQALAWYDKTNTSCAAVSSYFSNGEYNNDATFAKYVTLKDSMQLSIKQCAYYWREFAQVAADAGDRAELVLLKKNKLAGYVIPMKQSLIAIQQVNNMLSNKDADIDSITAKIASVQALVSQKLNDKNADFSKLNDAYYKEVYFNFYGSCNTSLNNLQRTADKIRAKAPEQDITGAYKSAGSAYNNAIEKYNTFIKQ
ncbi:hypothetical protein ACI6Q2_09705 [Chitinophagaceae bacterium LWZ2-11]